MIAPVQHVGAQAAVVGPAEFAPGDQVNAQVLLKQVDIGVRADEGLQGGFDGAPGGVGHVDDTPVAVAALAGEVIFGITVGLVLAGKGDTLVDKPAYGLRTVLDDKSRRSFIAQTGAGGQGVADMGFQRILFIKDDRDPALRI